MFSRFLFPVLAVAVAAALAAAGCERVPLLAPTASTITVSSPATSLPPGGSTDVTAFVIESAGTPVHNGTLVRFSATLGQLDPVEVETRGGIATTRFIAGNASGTAQIRATSGAATGGDGGTNLLEIQIGAAAAGSVSVSATPSQVPASGGTVAIAASAHDAAGNRLVGVPVTFTTTAGSLSASVATTDSSGEARVSLATNREAVVTARVGDHSQTTTVFVGIPPSVTIATSPASPLAGSPVTLTLTPASGTAPRVIVDWGDGTTSDLGTVAATRSVTHTYATSGHYTVVVEATADGDSFTTATSVTIGSAATVTLGTPSPATPLVGSPMTLTVTPAAGTAPRVVMNWGDGTSTDLGTVNAPRGVAHTYEAPGSYIISAIATAGGDTFTTSTVVTVIPRSTISVSVSASPSSPQRCQSVTFVATATPNTESISSYEWDIASATPGENESVTTTGDRLTRVFATIGTKTITVDAVTADGRRGTGQTQISVLPDTPPAACVP